MKLYDTWTNIKVLIDTHNLPIDYLESNDLYKISISYEQNIYNTELWINTDKISGIDLDQNNIDLQDFENNYKNNAKGIYNKVGVPGSGVQTVKAIPQFKQSYKCKTIEVTADENVYDLGSIYTEFTLIVSGDKNVIIKLNDPNNDEIPLLGGQNIRDIIGADAFEINKIYHKTTGSGDESELLLWAIK